MSRALADLDGRFRPVAESLIARAVEAGIAVLIVTTLRSVEEQRAAVAAGTSWTQHSKHLPQPPDGKSWAIDLALFEHYELHGSDKLQWDEADPAYQRLGAIGESLGLKWGVVLAGPRHTDLGHFEWSPDGPLPTKAERLAKFGATA